MIISVDGYDGTGKTTLAKNIAKKYGFTYIEKPIIKMIQHKNNCSQEDAVKILKETESQLFTNSTKAEITKFYADALVWLKQFGERNNIVLDRGLLTIYAVTGTKETEAIFDQYIKDGAFFDASIYLTAKDEERVRRIYERDPNDPDLKHPVKWRENNLEEYATSRNLNYHKISTNNRTTDEVFEEAIKVIDKEIYLHNTKDKSM